MKVQLDDVVVIPCQVEIPDKCPACNADFLEVGLYHWELQDQKRKASVKLTDDDKERYIDWDGGLPKSGEDFMAIEWRCGLCEESIAVRRSETVSDPEMIKVIHDIVGWEGR